MKDAKQKNFFAEKRAPQTGAAVVSQNAGKKFPELSRDLFVGDGGDRRAASRLYGSARAMGAGNSVRGFCRICRKKLRKAGRRNGDGCARDLKTNGQIFLRQSFDGRGR